jgi:hypothetical protein|nr:MAG TPA: hypothetical protein [Bacteriophage sp.]
MNGSLLFIYIKFNYNLANFLAIKTFSPKKDSPTTREDCHINDYIYWDSRARTYTYLIQSRGLVIF